MNISEQIKKELEQNDEVAFEGTCHDCGTKVCVVCFMNDSDDVVAEGGAIYNPKLSMDPHIFLKCDSCFNTDKTLRKFMSCEVYSRVVGYLRPINQWNKGKKEEFEMRKEFKVD